MEGYQVGDISSLLNDSTAELSTNSLFSNSPTVKVTVEAVYATPKHAVPVGETKGKRRKKEKKKVVVPVEPEEPQFAKLSPEDQLAVDKRTLFVGNLPIGLKRKQLNKIFAEFGKIESLRFRSVAISNPKLGRKACLKSNKINENASTKNAYIVYEDKDCVEKACCKNGTLLNERHIRTDKIVKSKKELSDDSQASVFIGNIPFSATEEDIRSVLSQCGDIEYVRLLRDKETNICKGSGYVKFSDSSGVLFAMKIKDSIEVKGRRLRIQKCKSKLTLDNLKKTKDRKMVKNGKDNGFRGRKSKGSDKDIFNDKKKKTWPKKKKYDQINRKSGPKKNTMSQKKFDKKVNKVSKKDGERSGQGKKGKKRKGDAP